MKVINVKINNQRGVALFVTLIFLLILTLLGISGLQTTILQEKMAGNFNDSNRAFQATETSIRVAESWLQDLASQPDDVSSAPSASQVWSLMVAGSTCTGTDMWWRQCANSWWVNNAVQVTQNLEKVSTKPYYIIEEQEQIPDSINTGGGTSDNSGRTLYRVTSKGTGGSDLTRVLIQTSYTRRY